MQTAVRRRPVQRRSVERFERILDSCAELLDDVGYAGLTTKEVARRARVPIGTLYQFFPGMEGLLGALARRNLDQYTERLSHRVEAARPADLGALVDLAVEEYVAMHRSTPGFGVIDFGSAASTAPPSAALADPLSALAVELLADSPRRPPQIALRVALEASGAVLRLAFRDNPEGDPALIAECARLIRSYLA